MLVSLAEFISFICSFIPSATQNVLALFLLLYHLLGEVKRNRFIALQLDRHLQFMYVQAVVGAHCRSFYSNCCVGGWGGTGVSIHQQRHTESTQVFMLLLKVEGQGKAFWDFLLVK